MNKINELNRVAILKPLDIVRRGSDLFDKETSTSFYFALRFLPVIVSIKLFLVVFKLGLKNTLTGGNADKYGFKEIKKDPLL